MALSSCSLRPRVPTNTPSPTTGGKEAGMLHDCHLGVMAMSQFGIRLASESHLRQTLNRVGCTTPGRDDGDAVPALGPHAFGRLPRHGGGIGSAQRVDDIVRTISMERVPMPARHRKRGKHHRAKEHFAGGGGAGAGVGAGVGAGGGAGGSGASSGPGRTLAWWHHSSPH